MKNPPVIIPISVDETHDVNHTININRAPTDESVRLLRDMEQQAKDQVIKAVKVGSTHFECVVHVMREHLSYTVTWRAVFKIGGKQMMTEFSRPADQADPEAMAVGLREAVAKAIADEILNEPFFALSGRM